MRLRDYVIVLQLSTLIGVRYNARLSVISYQSTGLPCDIIHCSYAHDYDSRI